MPNTPTPTDPQRQGRFPGAWPFPITALLALAVALSSCSLETNEVLMRQGHQAMVECQHGERAITDGDELRCEDWDYVRRNYLERSRSERPGAEDHGDGKS